ncbi:MAG: nitroreductase family protein [Peptostreptococcaceae bacterium]|nr:nitroreductase family protein [Peptostreptococcaceae bacterium]
MRDFNYDIHEIIKSRWSPKAFSEEAVEYEDVMAILEAARYAPSCFNEQPWEFLVAFDEEELSITRQCINERNRLWADKAPVLIVVAARPIFKKNEKVNRWATFDAGTAWGYMSIEAEKRGLISHAMGGFSRKKLRELISVPEEMHLLAIIAVGKMGNKDDLNEMFIEEERANERKPLKQVFTRIKEMER